jgi:hypothetical protein
MAGMLSRWKWTLIGCGLTPIALLIGLWSAGAGHGDYVWARIIYPVPSIAMRLFVPEPVAVATIAVGLFQFVLYGLILDLAGRRGAALFAAALLSVFHCALIFILFRLV